MFQIHYLLYNVIIFHAAFEYYLNTLISPIINVCIINFTNVQDLNFKKQDCTTKMRIEPTSGIKWFRLGNSKTKLLLYGL